MLQGLEEKLEEKGEEIYYASTEPEDTHITQDHEGPKISIHAMLGTPKPNTMRLIGQIRGEPVVILVDSSNIHNFLDPSIVYKYRLLVNPSSKLNVKIANGQIIISGDCCKEVTLHIQGNQFTTSFFILSLGGCNIVLGV